MTRDPYKIKVLNQCRIREECGPWNSSEGDGMNGAFLLPFQEGKVMVRLKCLSSDGEGWEHVSITRQGPRRESRVCPSWEMMCKVKRMFWDDEECVVEFHVPMAEWVSDHPGCLHLWKKSGYEFPRPPSLMVGVGE